MASPLFCLGELSQHGPFLMVKATVGIRGFLAVAVRSLGDGASALSGAIYDTGAENIHIPLRDPIHAGCAQFLRSAIFSHNITSRLPTSYFVNGTLAGVGTFITTFFSSSGMLMPWGQYSTQVLQPTQCAALRSPRAV